MCTGMSCFGRVWWGFVVLLGIFFVFCFVGFFFRFVLKGWIFLETLNVNVSDVTLPFLSAPFLGPCFNEVSRDEGSCVVMLQNAQRSGSRAGRVPPLPFSPEMLSQVVVYKSNQVNVPWEGVPVLRRTRNP